MNWLRDSVLQIQMNMKKGFRDIFALNHNFFFATSLTSHAVCFVWLFVFAIRQVMKTDTDLCCFCGISKYSASALKLLEKNTTVAVGRRRNQSVLSLQLRGRRVCEKSPRISTDTVNALIAFDHQSRCLCRFVDSLSKM